MTLEETIKHCEEVAEKNEESIAYYTRQGDKEWLDECEKDCIEFANEHRQLAEWLKRLKRIEDYIADGKDDMECTYSLCFWEIEAVMNGEILGGGVMPNSLRSKIKHLAYKGEFNERERDRLLSALDHEKDVTYICDGKKCPECSKLCNHTTDISHAINFEPGMSIDEKTVLNYEEKLPRYKPIILQEHDAEPRTLRAILDTSTDEIYVYKLTRQGTEILGMTIEEVENERKTESEEIQKENKHS